MWFYIFIACGLFFVTFIALAIYALRTAPYMEEICDEPAPAHLVTIIRQKALSERLEQRARGFDDYLAAATATQRRIERDAFIRQIEQGEGQ